MDIQRGDQVTYRGEVWKVEQVYMHEDRPNLATLKRLQDDGHVDEVWAWVKNLEKVEQPR